MSTPLDTFTPVPYKYLGDPINKLNTTAISLDSPFARIFEPARIQGKTR